MDNVKIAEGVYHLWSKAKGFILTQERAFSVPSK
jgi:hypothetical protein